jgi:hypothetical protein
MSKITSVPAVHVASTPLASLISISVASRSASSRGRQRNGRGRCSPVTGVASEWPASKFWGRQVPNYNIRPALPHTQLTPAVQSIPIAFITNSNCACPPPAQALRGPPVPIRPNPTQPIEPIPYAYAYAYPAVHHVPRQPRTRVFAPPKRIQSAAGPNIDPRIQTARKPDARSTARRPNIQRNPRGSHTTQTLPPARPTRPSRAHQNGSHTATRAVASLSRADE